MLFTVSDRPLSVLSVPVCFPVLYMVLYNNYSPTSPLAHVLHQQHDKVHVPVAEKQERHFLNATGRRKIKYSGQAFSSSISVAHVPSQSMSSMTATNDNNR